MAVVSSQSLQGLSVGLQCQGSESSVHQCLSQPVDAAACSTNYAAVKCTHAGMKGKLCIILKTCTGNDYLCLWSGSDGECTPGAVRLVNGPSDLEGTVEVCFNNNGHWGSLCDDGWDNSDASVVCKQLGFSTTGYCNILNHTPISYPPLPHPLFTKNIYLTLECSDSSCAHFETDSPHLQGNACMYIDSNFSADG